MRFTVLTILPETLEPYLGASILGKARERGVYEALVINPRDFADDKHRTVDDAPYGGGPGMVMKPEPLARALDAALAETPSARKLIMSPQGRRFDQRAAEEMARAGRDIVMLCGRYEGVDQRVIDAYELEEWSAGDYVLTGGELPALVIIDAVVRLLPGALGDEGSLTDESFSWGILDYPHYTRPQQWRGMRVPDALVNGNHREIARMRRREALAKTLSARPDLMASAEISEEDRELIREIQGGAK